MLSSLLRGSGSLVAKAVFVAAAGSMFMLAGSGDLRAAVPRTTSYQGVLTDGVGVPVADGPYDLTFRIYDTSFGGTALWSESHAAVAVTRGNFAVVLGSITPIALPFHQQLFLGVTVGASSELAPRVVLTPSLQSLALRMPFAVSDSSSGPMLSVANTGTGPAIHADQSFRAGTVTRYGRFDLVGPPVADILLSGRCDATGGQLFGHSPDGSVMFGLHPYFSTFGNLWLTGQGGPNGIFMSGNGGSAPPDPLVQILGATSSIVMHTGSPNSSSVILPARAIDASEVLDEPGLAQNRNPINVNLPASSATMLDVLSVTVTTPAPGYIVVDANAQHAVTGNGTVANEIDLSIKDTPGGTLDANYWFVSGFSTTAPNGLTRWPVSMRRTFFRNAGTWTFYFQARPRTNPSALSNYLWQPTITATYLPTSYGSVAVSASPAEASAESLVPLPRRATPSDGAAGLQGDGESVLVDLRELELRASRLREATLDAELQLMRARQHAATRSVRAVTSGVTP